jgi:hypothetical protein
MEEFQEMIDRGPSEDVSKDDVGEELDDLFGEEDDQFSDSDMPVAKACLGILKCSRGAMKLTLDVFEDLGTRYAETHDEVLLENISKIHEYARGVGEGVTDLGSSMYPPILPNAQGIHSQVQKQVDHIVGLLDHVLGTEGLARSEIELAHLLRVAIETRHKEFNEAIDVGKQ